jgi:hypothetical protein
MANVKISDMTAGGALGGTELFEMVQGGLTRSTTAAALATLAGAALNASNLTSGTVPEVRLLALSAARASVASASAVVLRVSAPCTISNSSVPSSTPPAVMSEILTLAIIVSEDRLLL